MGKFFLLLISLFPFLLIANSKTYITEKTNGTIIIDGNLNENAWQNCNWGNNFTMFIPYDNKPASQKTEFAIIYDQNFLYVAIKAYDSEPKKIVKRLTRRDDTDGDWLALQFDSYHDLQTAVEFRVSAAGSKFDKYVSGDGNRHDESWNAIWWAKTAIVADGWVAEMKIPFSQLRFVNKNVQTWGLQVGRYIQRNEETSLWIQKKRDDAGWVSHFGTMEGIVDIKPKKVFDLYPYIVGSVDTYERDIENPFLDGTDIKGNAGIDGKIGITNNLTLDFTINPDFGQVEADPSSVNLSGFELFFREQRPFFVEGSNIMNFPIMFNDGEFGVENLFYSRRIGRNPHHSIEPVENDSITEYVKEPTFTRIIGAAKVTGRTKSGLSIGIMEAITAEEKSLVENNLGETHKETVEPLTNYSVVSLQQDINKGNTIIGGTFTSTNRLINENNLENINNNAYSGGVSFTQYWKDKTWYLSSKFNFSHIEGTAEAIRETQESSSHYFQRPDGNHINYDTTRTSLTGTGGNIFFGKNGGGRFRFMSALLFKSPELELNDVGFVRHTDEIIQVAWIGYQINQPFFIFKEFSLGFDQWSSADYSGQLMAIGTSFNLNTDFKNNYDFNLGINTKSEDNSTSFLRGGPSYKLPPELSGWFWFGTDSRKMVRFNGNVALGAGKYNWFKFVNYQAGITIKPFNFIDFNIQGRYNPRTSEQQFVTEIEEGTSNPYILGTLKQKTYNLSLRINCNITPDISIQYWGQPFWSTGEYTNFKFVTNPAANAYTNRFTVFNSQQMPEDNDFDVISVDENLDGIIDFEFDNPDFNTRVFLSNLVFRWEYQPGSTFFFVWSQNRENYDVEPDYTFPDNVRNTFNFKAHNTFLIKLSYRIGI